MKAPWFSLKSKPCCKCGYTMDKPGLLRDLQSDKNHRPGPSRGVIMSSVATVRMDCRACGRSWDQQFLCVDRFERGPFGPPVPTDCYPLRWDETPDGRMDNIMAGRKRAEEQRKERKGRLK